MEIVRKYSIKVHLAEQNTKIKIQGSHNSNREEAQE